MDPNIEDGTDTDQPADDIRSSLAAAFAEAEAPEADANATTTAPKTDGTDAGTSGETRVRGSDGKFLKKDDAAPSDPAKAAAAAKTEQPDPNAPAAPAADTKDAPASWPAAEKELFKTLPENLKKIIVEREHAQLADYTRKTQEISAFKKEYGPVDEMFAPHKEVLRQKGFTPRSLIESWVNVETKLAAGPDSAIEVIKGLLTGYQIPVEKLASALGLSRAQAAQVVQAQPGQQPTAVENGQQVALPPEVAAELKALREQVTGVTSWKSQQEQQAANQQRAQDLQQEQAAENTVNEFRNSKDDKGNLLHPHMAEVEGMMTALANAALASKQPVPSLKELYETAVYATPSTREKVLTAERQQEEAKRTEAARTKAASARRAGSSVIGAPGSGQAPSGKPASGDSIRDSLEAAFEDVA